MTALYVQTLLLLTAAYFLGAMLACFIKRALFARASESAGAQVERRVDPLPEVAQAAAAGARFGPARGTEPSQPAAAKAVVLQSSAAQDLKRIRGIDADIETRLNELSVSRYDQIAAWKQADVRRIEQTLNARGRINQENWIEQAHVLAQGGETWYSARRARGEAATAEPTPDEGEKRTIASGAAPGAGQANGQAHSASPPRVAERAAFAASPAPQSAVPVRPAAPSARDNLQRIGGIDADIEQRLGALTVTRYSQIASWSPADVERFDRQLGTNGRIARENWVEQAQILSRGGDTAFSREFDRRVRSGIGPPPRPTKLADAIREHASKTTDEVKSPSRTDLGSLRSMRSEAYQNPEPGPEAAQRAAAQNKVLRSAAMDDLKRIRGIGVLIERKLNSMGIVSYEQIANWTADDIERVSQSLDFKGRIERENWVEQARILASGGATEFSRRVDRGEIETSRYRS